MEFLTTLWLPILLSAVFVFIVSSILHVCLPIHRGDYRKLPGEDSALEALRTEKIQPGTYRFPFCGSMKEGGSPEMLERYNRGPVGIMTVLPNAPPAVGKSLIQWFLYSIVISIFVGYIGTLTLAPGEGFIRVFRVTGAIAVLAYGVTHANDAIWKGQSWCVTLKYVFDGVLYGVATAATFGWLWPGAA